MKKVLVALLFLGLAVAPQAQALTVTPTNNGATLVSNILGSGITVSNIAFTGSATSAGTFTNGGALGIGSGILLTSGSAPGAVGPNNSTGYTGYVNTGGDADLSTYSGKATYDKTVLEFDFVSQGGNVFFNYVFASEEYNEWSNSSYNDVFAFLLDGVNIALIPGTNIPVSVNTVNGGHNDGTGYPGADPQNIQYYNNNPIGGPLAGTTQYDGFTDVFTASMIGLSAGTHHIKLAIADASDTILDSGVFIQAGSFSDVPTDPVPEPGTLLLLGSGLVGLARHARNRTRK